MKIYTSIFLNGLLLGLLFIGFSSSTVLALTRADMEAIERDTVWYEANTGARCTTAPASGGAVRYPKNIDDATLAANINNYISKTRPDSPLIPFSNDFVRFGKQYDVNPAFTVAIAQKESSLGTNGTYAKPPMNNIFSIRGDTSGPNGFSSYPDIPSAIEAANRLLASGVYLGSPANFTTIEDVMNKYAPSQDRNDPAGYSTFVNEVIQKILGTAVESNATCIENANGVVTADGYAFPLAPQKKGPISAGYPLPCNRTSCHHDGTPAFDLAWKPLDDSTAGASVYAISDGIIDDVRIYKSIEGCYSFQLHSTKDNFLYWYGHLRNPLVSSGDTVKAGQKIAEVGERQCTGNGSYPHLHIDRGCILNNIPQKGGRQECRDPGMIQVINVLWDSLPL